MRRSIDIVKHFTLPDRPNKNQAYFITLKHILEQIYSRCLNTKILLKTLFIGFIISIQLNRVRGFTI